MSDGRQRESLNGAEGRRRDIDEAVQRRIAEISAAAGVPHSRASLEVLYYLPQDFLKRYSELFHASLRLDSGGVGGRDSASETAKVPGKYKGTMPGVTGGGKRYKEFWVVRSDDLLDLKKRVDKRLRTIGRDIALELSGGDEAEKAKEQRWQCTRCGRLGGRDWKFCAECGNHRPVGGE